MITRMRTIGSLALVAALTLGGVACSSSGSSASFCSELKSQSAELSKPNMSDADALKKSAAAFKSLEAKAPAEIKDDMKVLADYLDKVANTDTSNLSALQSLQGDASKIQSASENITKYAKDTCNVDLNS